MKGKSATTIGQLRQRLVQARREQNLALLEELEEQLGQLASSWYRCCLLDYEECRTAYYVRLQGYENARLKAELEYPIESRFNAVQWLPLSHLADYHEAESKEAIHRIYTDLEPFIHHKVAELATTVRNGRAHPLPRPRLPISAAGNKVWWYMGGVLLLASLFVLIAVQWGHT